MPNNVAPPPVKSRKKPQTAIVPAEKMQVDGRPVAAVEVPQGRYARLVLVDLLSQGKNAVPEWGKADRDQVLYDLARDVDLLSDAIAFLGQKVSGMPFVVEGPERTARRYRDRLVNVWSAVAAAWVYAICASDKGGYCQVLRFSPKRAVNEDGTLTDWGKQAIEDGTADAWEFAGLLPLDSRRCTPTGDPDKPVTYQPSVGEAITFRAKQVLCVVDNPITDVRYPGWGLCGVSRCLDIARLRSYVAAYFREAFSEGPRAGIVALANVHIKDWESIVESIETGQAQKGINYYKGMVVLTNSEATQPIGIQEIPFRIAPEGWSQRDTYTESKEIVAAAFGLDPLEFGAMPGQGLGSSEQSTVMHQKSKGKFLAYLLQAIEREFRKILPAQLVFRFVAQDVEEEKEKATLAGVHITNVNKLWLMDPTSGEQLINTQEARQMLADCQVIPREFLQGEPDVTDVEQVGDTEAEQAGPAQRRVKAWSNGDVVYCNRAIMQTLYRVLGKKQAPSTRHPRKNVAAVTAYEEELRWIYDEWADEAAKKLEAADEEDRERMLAALLLLLASRLKAAGRASLQKAYEQGLDGEAPTEESMAALGAAFTSNDSYIDTSLMPDVRERFARDIAVPGFAWTGEMLLPALSALSWRTKLYGGQFWATLALGIGVMVATRHDNPPVRRFLDPTADHCDTCPGKEREYDSWDDMIAYCGGPPGTGDACDGNCRCGVEALVNGQWVTML